MKITLTDAAGRTPAEGVADILRRYLNALTDKDAREAAASGMLKKIREHVSNRYPGSKHWNPRRVVRRGDTVYVGIEGASRAYRDIDIYPKKANWLTIPVYGPAKGHSAREFTGLFRPKGRDFLGRVERGMLVVYYALSKHVHQRQDRTLMPDDTDLAQAAFAAVWRNFQNRR